MYCRIPKNKRNNRLAPPPPTSHIWICYCYVVWLISCSMFIHRFTTHPDNLLQQPCVKTIPDVPTFVFPPVRTASSAHARVGWWWRQMARRVLFNQQLKRHLQVCVTSLTTSAPPTGMCYFPSDICMTYRYVLLPFRQQSHLQVCVNPLLTSAPPTGMCYLPYDISATYRYVLLPFRVAPERKSFCTHLIV